MQVVPRQASLAAHLSSAIPAHSRVATDPWLMPISSSRLIADCLSKDGHTLVALQARRLCAADRALPRAVRARPRAFPLLPLHCPARAALSRAAALRSTPPPSRTNWTRLVHPSVLIGHVSSRPAEQAPVIDRLWADRPAPPAARAFVHPLALASRTPQVCAARRAGCGGGWGLSTADKHPSADKHPPAALRAAARWGGRCVRAAQSLVPAHPNAPPPHPQAKVSAVRAELAEAGADALVVSALDDVPPLHPPLPY